MILITCKNSHYLNNEENALTLENAAYKIEDFFLVSYVKYYFMEVLRGL